MGYNTVLVIFNDNLHVGAEDADLGKRIQAASRSWHSRKTHPGELSFFARSGNSSASYGAVISQEHADYSQVVVVGRNSGRRIVDCDDLDHYATGQIADALRRHGWKVSPPSKKAKRGSALSSGERDNA